MLQINKLGGHIPNLEYDHLDAKKMLFVDPGKEGDI